MEMPRVKNTIRDGTNNVTYHVLAYRSLTKEELLLSVKRFHSQPKIHRRKTPLRNMVITIISILGATPGL
jgi:hypothetical protein